MSCVRPVRKGRWKYDFRDHKGVRHVKATFRTKAEAERALRACEEKLDRGIYVSPRELPTFRELAEEWFDGKRAHHPASRAQWRSHLDLHLLPALGHRRLDSITATVVERLVRDAMAEKPRRAGATMSLTPRTINKVLTTGAAIFKVAERRNLVERNPFALAERLREGGGELKEDTDRAREDGRVRPEDVPTSDELRLLIDAAEAGFYRTLFLTAALTGARPGELRALRWSQIDLENGVCSIRRAHSHAHVRGEQRRPEGRVYAPKTQAGVRDIPLEPPLVAALRRWKLQCSPTSGDLVFPGPSGLPFHESSVLRQGLYPAWERANLRRFSLYALRHWFASFLILKGAPVTEVAHLLGHSDPTVTLRRYTHWFRNAKSEAMGALARAVCGDTW